MTIIRELMRTELVTVDPSTIVMDAAHAMSVGQVGSALVLQGDTLVGIFTERDIVHALAESSNADAGRASSVAAWMTEAPTTIGPDATVGAALDLMLAGGFRHLPVVVGGSVTGIVSMRDLARNIARD